MFSLEADHTNVIDCGGTSSPERRAQACEALTTVVIRKVPQTYTRDKLLELLDSEGFKNQYNLVYLPMDFGSRCSFGYAFVNLVSAKAAQRFHDVFAGFTSWSMPSDNEAEVNWAILQGLDQHVEKYRNSPVMHELVCEESKPILLKDGIRAEFPAPTKKIGLVKRPRNRRYRSKMAEQPDMLETLGESAADGDRGASPTPEGLSCWDYQDTDEELQLTKPHCRNAREADGDLVFDPLLAGSPLLAGLVTVSSPRRNPRRQRVRPVPSSVGISRQRQRHCAPPPGTFGLKQPGSGSDINALSDCSTCFSAASSVACGSGESMRKGYVDGSPAPLQQQLASSVSLLAHGLEPSEPGSLCASPHPVPQYCWPVPGRG